MNKVQFLIVLASLGSAITVRAATVTYTSKPSFLTDSGAALLDDFESFAPKDVWLPTLTSQGITYTGLLWNVGVVSPGQSNFGAGVGITTTSILTANGEVRLSAVLSTPMSALGFDVYLNGLGRAFVEFYSGVNSVGFIELPGTADDIRFAGITSTDPITGFFFYSTNGGLLKTGIDNILASTAPTAVPEGGTTVFLMGLAGLALAILRKTIGRR